MTEKPQYLVKRLRIARIQVFSEQISKEEEKRKEENKRKAKEKKNSGGSYTRGLCEEEKIRKM